MSGSTQPHTILATELADVASLTSMRRMRSFIATELLNAREFGVADAQWFGQITLCLERIDASLAAADPMPSAKGRPTALRLVE